ncbi:hypothetical protein BH24DEI2_BH24DEI2_17340 [soil metagenome]
MPVGTNNKTIPGAGSHHIALQTVDWDASLKLYRDVLGMEVVAEFGTPERKIMLLDIGDGSHIELFQPTGEVPGSEGDAPYMHFAIATTDTRAALEHVRRAGYEITVEPKTVKLDKLTVTIAFFKGRTGRSWSFARRTNKIPLGPPLRKGEAVALATYCFSFPPLAKEG